MSRELPREEGVCGTGGPQRWMPGPGELGVSRGAPPEEGVCSGGPRGLGVWGGGLDGVLGVSRGVPLGAGVCGAEAYRAGPKEQ